MKSGIGGLSKSLLTLPIAGRDHLQGPINAPIALVEYGDYQCPYCGQAYPVLKALQRRLGNRVCNYRELPDPHLPAE